MNFNTNMTVPHLVPVIVSVHDSVLIRTESQVKQADLKVVVVQNMVSGDSEFQSDVPKSPVLLVLGSKGQITMKTSQF